MKQIFSFYSFVFLFFLAVTSCNDNKSAQTSDQPKSDTLDEASMKKIVEDANLKYDQAFVSGDSVTAINHFTEDARVFAPNMEQLIGKSAIAPVLGQYMKFGIKKFTDSTTRVFKAGEYIVEEGNYFFGGDNNSTLDKGKYLCVWKKEDGEWRVGSNMWNTSMPMSAAEKK